MLLINSSCTFPIDKIIEVCKVAYDNLNAKRTEKINGWVEQQQRKHQQTHLRKWIKSTYNAPTDQELMAAASDQDKDNLARLQSFHRDDGIIICTVHESAVFAKQHGVQSMQVDANSLYAIHFWYDKLADKK